MAQAATLVTITVCLSVCLSAHVSCTVQAAADAEDINAQEKLFGMASSKYSQVARMAAKLEPYCGLWTLAARFYDKCAGWMSGPFSKLKPEEVETEVSDAYRKVYKLSKVGSCLYCKSALHSICICPLQLRLPVASVRHTCYACKYSAVGIASNGQFGSVHMVTSLHFLSWSYFGTIKGMTLKLQAGIIEVMTLKLQAANIHMW